jgi:hypothetical protein
MSGRVFTCNRSSIPLLDSYSSIRVVYRLSRTLRNTASLYQGNHFDFYNLSVVLTRLDRRPWSASLIKPLGGRNQSVRCCWQLVCFNFLSHHDCLHYSLHLPCRIQCTPLIFEIRNWIIFLFLYMKFVMF